LRRGGVSQCEQEDRSEKRGAQSSNGGHDAFLCSRVDRSSSQFAFLTNYATSLPSKWA
jgi:hypothetical protein